MQAVIQAGGLGTRIRAVAKDIPKALVPIGGRPVIFRQIDKLLAAEFTDIYILAGYMGDLLADELKKEYGSASIHVIQETSPLGSGGCLSLVKPKIKGESLIFSGDLVFDIDFERLLQFHDDKGADLTLVTHPNTHPADSDLVSVDNQDRVNGLLLRPHPKNFRYRNLVNASMSVANHRFWTSVPNEPRVLNFEKDLVQNFLQTGGKVFSYNTSEYLRDMGTPDRWESVSDQVLRGIPESRSLGRKQKAIFLDRDGVINVHKSYITAPDQITIADGVMEALKKLNRSEYLQIIITNQPQVAMNLIDEHQLSEIHKEVETLLGNNGVKVDDIFYCPHHPDSGFPGENKALKIECECRKPAPGLILNAAARYNIDLTQSYTIGDSWRDIRAGKAAGTKTILVESPESAKESKHTVEADFKCANLLEALKFIKFS